jgi:hypothetical protein
MRWTIMAFWFLAWVVLAGTPVAAQEKENFAKEVEGKWRRTERTPRGLVTLVKEHAAGKTTLSTFDDQGRPLYAHASTYSVERAGKLRVFTVTHRMTTAGPNAGEIAKEPIAFVYRVAGDRFIEAYGLLEADSSPPMVIVWERVRD